MPGGTKPPYLSLAGILAAVGGVCMVVLNRWKDIEPILESPAMIVLAMLTNFSAGAFSSYWLVARPHEERLRRAEAVINRLRDQERALLTRVSELEVAKARLEERLTAIEARVPARKPRTPKA